MSPKSSKLNTNNRVNEGLSGYFMNALLVVFLGTFSKSINQHIAIEQRDPKDYRAALIAQLAAYLLLAGLLGGETADQFHDAWQQGSLMHYILGAVCGFFGLRAVYMVPKMVQLLKGLKTNTR